MGQNPSASGKIYSYCSIQPASSISIIKLGTTDTGTQCESDHDSPSLTHRSSYQDLISTPIPTQQIAPLAIVESNTDLSPLLLTENYNKVKIISPSHKLQMNNGDAFSCMSSESEDEVPRPGKGIVISLPDGCKVISHGAAIHQIRSKAPNMHLSALEKYQKTIPKLTQLSQVPRVKPQILSTNSTVKNYKKPHETLKKISSEKVNKVLDLRKYGALTPNLPNYNSQAYNTPQSCKALSSPKKVSYRLTPKTKTLINSSKLSSNLNTPVVRINIKDIQKTAQNLKLTPSAEYFLSDRCSFSEMTARNVLTSTETFKSLELQSFYHDLDSKVSSRNSQEIRQISAAESEKLSNGQLSLEPPEILEGEKIKKVPIHEFSFFNPSFRRSKSQSELKTEETERSSRRFETLQEQELTNLFELRSQQQTPQLVVNR